MLHQGITPGTVPLPIATNNTGQDDQHDMESSNGNVTQPGSALEYICHPPPLPVDLSLSSPLIALIFFCLRIPRADPARRATDLTTARFFRPLIP